MDGDFTSLATLKQLQVRVITIPWLVCVKLNKKISDKRRTKKVDGLTDNAQEYTPFYCKYFWISHKATSSLMQKTIIKERNQYKNIWNEKKKCSAKLQHWTDANIDGKCNRDD